MQVSYKILLLLLVSSSNVLSSALTENADSSRIVNGYAVDIRDVPYQASLRRRITQNASWSHFCGGVIITNKGVLTAAHCVTSYTSSLSYLRITVGTTSRLSGGDNFDISSIKVHDEYSSTTLQHDIALIVTSQEISFSQSILPISIANADFALPTGTEALVSGFGTTSYEGTSSNVLLAARVNIVAQEMCARAYLRIASITRGMLCAGALNPPRDACQGDSGGPLVVQNHLVGIVSWGEGCADSIYPGVYTRVSEYNQWIAENLN